MSGARILVIDDDDGVRGVAVRQLSSLGHRVIQASCGEEGLSLLERNADVDLLFVDISMPGMGGIEVAERAVRSRPQLKVMFASGNFDPGGVGTDARFIVKPYRKKELAEKVEEALGT